MRLLILSNAYDTGGIGSSIKQAFERHTDWEVRFVRRKANFLDYQPDIEWPRKTPLPSLVADLWRRADVVHMIDSYQPAASLPGYERKPRVIHHVGDTFRRDAEAYRARAKAEGITQLVCGFDLAVYGPELIWLPMVCDIERMERERGAYVPGPLVRVMQSPAARIHNDTDDFLAAVSGVTGMELSIIEGLPWREAIARKAQADILFDSFASGYGLSVMEAWAMGIPAMCGTADPVVDGLVAGTLGCLPYAPVTRETVAAELQTLVDSPAVRAALADMGRAAVSGFHSERAVVERLLPIYEAAMDRAVAA